MLVILSVAMIVADVRYSAFSQVRPYLTLLVTPIQVVVNTPQKMFNWAGEHLASREGLVKENQSLQSEILILRSRQQRLESLQAENVRLRELLDASQRVDEKIVMAEVIGFDQSAYSHRLMIDKGFSSGAYVGQPVLDATGVLGQVVETSAYSSRVLLIADANHFVPVQLSRTGFRGILRGTGSVTIMELMSVPRSVDIKKGDVLTTSGLDNRFPSGYPVGVVRSVKYTQGKAYADVEVVPLAQLGRSRHVMLIEKPKAGRS
ncbi:MAG: rod shape-determining protein MreC [Marinomonas foliarum]|uniref:Cell shape-determining protein MreC n=1 Tax=Marinomonas foliarum TaxID=491950 RepID=A0A368ZQH4_9GAMM|nr:rod shape-determining protein MreC [Marinomonas foliarum]RCW98249.1 rod shape-determining protein MreC [Marinomonas foliarum]